jgi:hypothetical protein
MRTIVVLATLGIILGFVAACAKPDTIDTYRSGDPNLFYTVEVFNGHGAPSSDFTRVYANLDSGGSHARELVLDGEYLIIGKLTWTNAKEVDICLSEGITNSFRNKVTLVAGDRSETIRNHLQQECESGKRP